MNSNNNSQNKSYHQQIELRPRTYSHPKRLQEQKRTYVKVGKDAKDMLSQLVFNEGYKIVDVAKILSIKYATAKTIIFQLRKENKIQKAQGTRICVIDSIEKKLISKIRVISMTASKLVKVYDHTFSLQEHDPNNITSVRCSSSLTIHIQQ